MSLERADLSRAGLLKKGVELFSFLRYHQPSSLKKENTVKMKVLLKHDVTKLGKAGQVKNVADGYARNYLIPQGMAVLATPGAMKQADVLARSEQMRQAKLASDASAVAEAIKQVTLTFTARVGGGGKLYGSITTQQVAEELKRVAGIEIDKRKLELREPIRSLGTHKVAVHLATDLEPEITVNVVSEEVAAEAA